jgi:hypothetical protein
MNEKSYAEEAEEGHKNRTKTKTQVKTWEDQKIQEKKQAK